MGTITLGNISTDGNISQTLSFYSVYLRPYPALPWHNVDNVPLAFLLCWWPYAVIFVRTTTMLEEKDKKANGNLLKDVVIPAYFNSLINPILYIAMTPDVKEELKNLILCKDLATIARQSTLSRSKDMPRPLLVTLE